MISYILKTDPITWTAEDPQPENFLQGAPGHWNWAEMPSGGETAAPDILAYPPVASANPQVIGGWRITDGSIAYPVDRVLYEALRPLGNWPGGWATDVLWPPYWQGLPLPKLEVTAEYPADVEPFDLEIRHKYFEDPLNPQWDGWGWRAEMIGASYARDPSVRAIAVYTTPEAVWPDDYDYTTGAFVEGPSEWQLDAEGNPLTVWYTETPVGRATVTKEAWSLGVLWASVPEGHQVLEPEQSEIRFLFWPVDQPDVGGQSQDIWVPSGETFTGILGANVLGVSSSAPFSAGQRIRIDGVELVIDYVHDATTIVTTTHPDGLTAGLPILVLA